MNTQTLNITTPRDLVKKVDLVAKKKYCNRSELIREALRVYLADKEEWEDIFIYGREKAKKMGIRNEEDIDKIIYEFRHGQKTK